MKLLRGAVIVGAGTELTKHVLKRLYCSSVLVLYLVFDGFYERLLYGPFKRPVLCFALVMPPLFSFNADFSWLARGRLGNFLCWRAKETMRRMVDCGVVSVVC